MAFWDKAKEKASNVRDNYNSAKDKTKEKLSNVKDNYNSTKQKTKDWYGGDSKTGRATKATVNAGAAVGRGTAKVASTGWKGIKGVGTGLKYAGLGIAWLTGKAWGHRDKLRLPHKTSAFSINLFIILALLYQFFVVILDIHTVQQKLLINLIFVLAVWFMVLQSDERNGETLNHFTIIILVLEIALPYFLNMYFFHVDIVRRIFLNPLLMAWWFYYALLIRAQSRTMFAKILEVLVVVWWVAFFLLTFSGMFSGAIMGAELGTVGGEQIAIAQDWLDSGFQGIAWLYNTVISGVTNVKGYWNQRISMATGDYYVGRVEETEGEKLGVYIDYLKPAAPEFDQDEKVMVWGILKAKTLDDGVKITHYCYEGNKDYIGSKITPGISGPEKEYRVYDISEEDVECTFAPKTLNKNNRLDGTYRVTIAAYFNFETLGYLKTYFMDQDRFRELARENIDPLDQFGITDQNPIALYTEGPVKLGIGSKKPPIAVDVGDVIRVGVTLDNNIAWQGKIKEIRQLVISVPDSLTFLPGECSHPFVFYGDEDNTANCVNDYITHASKPFLACLEQYTDVDVYDENAIEQAKTNPGGEAVECVRQTCQREFEGFRGYMLDTAKASGLKDIERYKTFSCKFTVANEQDKLKLLGTTPVTTRFIRAKTRYDYEIEKSTSVKVKKNLDQDPRLMQGIVGKTPVQAQQDIKVSTKLYSEAILQNRGNFQECQLFGIIQHTSQGNPNYAFNYRKGLMGVSEHMANVVAPGINLGSFNIFEAETNIKLGVASLNYLNQIQPINAPQIDFQNVKIEKLNDLLVVYKDTMEKGDYNYDALKASTLCPGLKVYECDKESVYDNYKSYLLSIENNMNYCTTNKLFEKTSAYTTEVNTQAFWDLPKIITVTQDSNEGIEALEQNYNIQLGKSIKPDSDYNVVSFTFKKNNQRVAYIPFSFNKDYPLDTEWHYPEYPFVRLRVKSAGLGSYTFEFQEFKNSVVKLEAPLGPLHFPVWKDSTGEYMKVLFSAKTLSFFNHDGKSVCTINIEIQNGCPAIPGLRFELIDVSSTLLRAWLDYDPERK